MFIIKKKYFQVTTYQLFLMAILTGVVAGALVIINTAAMDYLQLPMVTYADGKCASVSNFKNGDAYTCAEVDVTLRHYRKKQ